MQSRFKQSGFTLIEVMIALLIVGVGVIAVIDATNKYAASQVEIEKKLIADWVAANSLEQLRFNAKVDGIKVGNTRDSLEMGGIDWRVATRVEQTDVDSVYMVTTEVRMASAERDRVVSSMRTAIADIK